MNKINTYTITYICMVATVAALDLLWVAVVAKGFYYRLLGTIISDTPRWLPIILFYLIFAAGLLILATIPAIKESSISQALWLGMVAGLVVYGTYDLTNYALIQKWSLLVSVVDIVWGVILTGTVSTVGFTCMQWLANR